MNDYIHWAVKILTDNVRYAKERFKLVLRDSRVIIILIRTTTEDYFSNYFDY